MSEFYRVVDFFTVRKHHSTRHDRNDLSSVVRSVKYSESIWRDVTPKLRTSTEPSYKYLSGSSETMTSVSSKAIADTAGPDVLSSGSR